MKNLLILITILCLSSCAENNIAPIPPDQDAASKKMNNHITWNAFRFSLEDANVFLLSKLENEVWSDDVVNMIGSQSVYIITDGTELLNLYGGFYLNDWKNATYIFPVILTSYCGGTFTKGDYAYDLNYSCVNKGSWNMYNDLTGYTPNIPPLSAYPLVEFGGGSAFDAVITIKGKLNDGDKISFEWEGLMTGFKATEPPVPNNQYGTWKPGTVQQGDFPGSFYYKGTVKDISPNVMKALSGGRKSVSDYKEIMKLLRITNKSLTN